MKERNTSTDFLLFYVNGKEIIERHAEPEWTLLWYLRNKLKLTGSKLGCGEGGCGACTVSISYCIDKNTGEIEHRTINGCLAPLCSIDGCHIITVEGLGSTNKSNLHSTQTRLAEFYASQCGFCTPGMVMSLYGTVTSKDTSTLTMADIEESFDGNLCRCTGYRPILDAAKSFACDIDKFNVEKSSSPNTSTTFDKCASFFGQSIDQIPFPEKLRDYQPQSIQIKGSSMDWYRPITLTELIRLRQMYPGNESKLIFGNTSVQLERKVQQRTFPRLISITHVKELQEMKRTDDSIYLGAGVTFTRLKNQLMDWKDNPICHALLDQFKHFASTQIRNVASLGGHIVAALPNSDLNPVLLAAGALLELQQANSTEARTVPLSEFFLGRNRVSIEDNEILVAVRLPLRKSSNAYFIQSYKQACRRDDSKGVVSAGLQVELKQENDQWKIAQICLGFGGVAQKTIEARDTQQQLVGLPWSRETINRAHDLLLKEIVLNESSFGGRIQYKRTLIQSFLFKFYSYVSQQLHKSTVNLTEFSFNRPVSHAQQTVPERPESQKIVGSSMPHQSAYLHTTGEATYIADIPLLADTLHAALILSKKANARIKHISTERASKVPGFVSFVSHVDVPGLNKPNGVLPDEEVFASSIALCVGAVIGLVVCETEESAELAANLVDIDYECLSPTILSIDDAIEHGSYFEDEFRLQQGDIEKSLKESEHCLEDELYIGGQEHFYMETNACIAIPSNDDQEMTLHAAVQSPTAAQELVALVLGRDTSRITCHTKRIGGAFGGKESRAIVFCLATAVAAVKVARPVRLHLDRHTDIAVTGHRHPFKIKYQVGFNHDGHIQGLDIQMWNGGGCTLDASSYVLQLAMLHMGNTYRIPNMRIRGRVCKTHLPSNTAFRGFGGPQAMLACENIIEHISFYLQCDPLIIRRQNLFREGDRTHYGQCLELWNVPRIINELLETSGYDERRRLVDEFNRANIYRKRGISLVPVKFGISFVFTFLNQGGALVHIYKDGSVVISQGGIEIGQGLYTKMIAIAAEVLRCDIKRVRISETSTDKIHNISPTGGSVTADINGMAVKDACEQLRQRLDALITKEENDISWEDLIQKAYNARVDLCGRGFYVMPNMFDMDFSKNKATYNYFTQGAAVTEVELDVLTGDWHILRVDILMDVGTSLNPQIDIGQIEGGFMQGVGLYTMEELQWGDEKQHGWISPGQLYTLGPDTYKIPSFSDVPIDFRVSLLSNSSNPRAVFSSKGIGEPPLLFGTSAFFALKQACTAYRKQQGLENYFTLNSPASVERLRMACADEFTRRACNDQSHETFQPKGSY